MLTTTYSLMALSTEQTSTRMDLSVLLQHLHRLQKQQQVMVRNDIHALLNKINQFNADFQLRKVEKCLIPTLRRITKKSDLLIAEIESLGFLGLSVLRSIQNKLRLAMERGALIIDDVFNELELYCSIFLHKLEKEEQELFSMTRDLLSQEEWFSIAVQFLSHTSKYAVVRPVPQPPMPPINQVKFLSYRPASKIIHLESRLISALHPVNDRRYMREINRKKFTHSKSLPLHATVAARL